MIATLLLFACADKVEDTSVPSDSGDETPADGEDTETDAAPACSGLSETDCGTAGCPAIYGWPLDQQGDSFCYSEEIYEQGRSYAGCSSQSSALTVETFSGPSDGSACWLFSDGTILEGWVECGEQILWDCES